MDGNAGSNYWVNDAGISPKKLNVLYSFIASPGDLAEERDVAREVVEDVDVCDLFIGLIWKRWGQPTGANTSGFEEEFERARKRHAETGSPQIWLLFKHVESMQVEYTDEQFQRVVAFRKAQEISKELFFREFLDTSELKRKLHDWLLKYILELFSNTRAI